MALSASTARKRRNMAQGRSASYTVGTNAVIYHGSLVCLNSSTGRAVVASAATNRRFLGIAEIRGHASSVTGDTSGTVTVNVLFDHQEQITSAAALTKAYVGCNVAVSDDDTVTTMSGAGTALVRVRVGELIEAPASSKAWVWIRQFTNRDV